MDELLGCPCDIPDQCPGRHFVCFLCSPCHARIEVHSGTPIGNPNRVGFRGGVCTVCRPSGLYCGKLDGVCSRMPGSDAPGGLAPEAETPQEQKDRKI